MKKTKLALIGVLFAMAIGCKKAEKIEIEKPTQRTVSTIAGSGGGAYVNGIGLNTAFNSPQKLISDPSGNIYVADSRNHRIRKITPEGVVTSIAGSGSPGYADGTGATAQFNAPYGIAIDGTGNLFVTELGNHCIRKITPAGVVTTVAGTAGLAGFADGPGTEAKFAGPVGITIDGSNNLIVADIGNNRLRKITPTGVVSTFVGNGQSYFADGPIATATMYNVIQAVYDPSSGNIYAAQDCFIRKITPEGIVSVLAGSTDPVKGIGYTDGPGIIAKFYFCWGLTVDKKGNLYVADAENNVIRKITPDGFVSTYAGKQYRITREITIPEHQDGLASQALFSRPQGITINNTGDLIVSEAGGHYIRKISEIPFPDSPDDIARKNWNNPTGWK